MGSDAKAGYGATGRFDGLWFDPEDLTLEDDTQQELYDERLELPLDEALVVNIMRFGVLEPVLVSKQGARADKKPRVVVVDGRQRVRAAREANARLVAQGKVSVRVPGMIARADDFLGVMIATNELRFGNTPMAKARTLARYISLGRSDEEACIAFGVSRESIRQWKILLELHPDVQKAIANKEMPAHVAMKLEPVAYDEQPAALEKMRSDGELRGQAGERAARGAAGKTPAGATKLSLRITPTEVRALRRTMARADFRGALSAKALKVIDDIVERLTALEKRARGGPKP